ncbi:ATP-binding protein [Glaciecola siphonariae]|uniref:histidine kinase n=1 Tax=Glaciecola siphonariae TaxID=521012 RepID=A0ABV9LSR1_9ALTE
MSNTEKEEYLGSPTAHDNTFVFTLSSHLQENLTDICDLVGEVFDAHQCEVVVQYKNENIALLSLDMRNKAISDSALLSQQFDKVFSLVHKHQFERVQAYTVDSEPGAKAGASSCTSLDIISVPLVLLKGLKFGALVFSRPTRSVAEATEQNGQHLELLSQQEQRILKVIARDIQNFFIQRRERLKIEQSYELQRLMLQNNQDWIFVKNDEYKIVYANDAFLNIYPEHMRDKIIGYTTVEEYDEQEAEKFLLHDRIAFKEGVSETTEDLHLPDGSHVIVSTIKRRFEDKYGDTYILCVCRDITEKENLIRSLQMANQELDDFTSIASHDLKSPLNAIRRLLAWIEDETKGILPENAQENLQLVVSRAQRMHALLNDLLKFAKIGRDEVKVAQISLQKSVCDMRQLLDIPEHYILESDELLMTVPAVPLNTILLNLIANAFKHNDKELPSVHISASVSKHYYIINIKDNGPGIEPKYHERIFKLFQTLKPRDEVEGSGMGLSVVKKYIDYYQGKITLSSDGKNGATFTIYWPVGKPE